VERDGVYYAHWSLLVRCGAGDVVVTLEDRKTGTIYARSGAREGGDLISSSMVRELAKGTELVLRNRSGHPMLLGTANGNGQSWTAVLTVASL